MSKPFFATLQKWLFTGELHDPFNEFFVAANPKLVDLPYAPLSRTANLSGDGGFESGVGVDDDEGAEMGGQHLWENKFRFRKEMLPSFVSEEFGRKVCSVFYDFYPGKVAVIVYLPYCCHADLLDGQKFELCQVQLW